MRVQGRRYGTGRMHVTEKRVIALLNYAIVSKSGRSPQSASATDWPFGS